MALCFGVWLWLHNGPGPEQSFDESFQAGQAIAHVGKLFGDLVDALIQAQDESGEGDANADGCHKFGRHVSSIVDYAVLNNVSKLA